MTGRDLVYASLRLIGAVAPAETPAAAEATDGLAALNRMIGTWSAQNLLIHAQVRESPFTLTASDSTVTMGTSGDLTNRPTTIVAATIQDATSSRESPVQLLSAAEYAAIPNKTTTSTYPTALWDDGGFPQRTLTLWPVPSAAHKLVLYTERRLTEISTLDTSISLPPGYEDALTYNLAIRLAPEYGRSVPPEVGIVAVETMAAVKAANHRPMYLGVTDLPVQPAYGYDINVGPVQ